MKLNDVLVEMEPGMSGDIHKEVFAIKVGQLRGGPAAVADHQVLVLLPRRHERLAAPAPVDALDYAYPQQYIEGPIDGGDSKTGRVAAGREPQLVSVERALEVSYSLKHRCPLLGQAKTMSGQCFAYLGWHEQNDSFR